MATNSIDRQQWVLAALEEYEVRLMRFAERLLEDEHAARDVVQHTFLKLCDESPEDLSGRLALWLFTVCRNKAVDWIRQRRHIQFNSEFDQAGTKDPASEIEANELYTLLRALVDQLPANLREVVELWAQGFHYREIAQITDRTEAHVRLLNHRALSRLRQHPTTRAIVGDHPGHSAVPHETTEDYDVFKVA